MNWKDSKSLKFRNKKGQRRRNNSQSCHFPFFRQEKKGYRVTRRDLSGNGLRSKRFTSVTFAMLPILCGAQCWRSSPRGTVEQQLSQKGGRLLVASLRACCTHGQTKPFPNKRKKQKRMRVFAHCSQKEPQNEVYRCLGWWCSGFAANGELLRPPSTEYLIREPQNYKRGN